MTLLMRSCNVSLHQAGHTHIQHAVYKIPSHSSARTSILKAAAFTASVHLPFSHSSTTWSLYSKMFRTAITSVLSSRTGGAICRRSPLTRLLYRYSTLVMLLYIVLSKQVFWIAHGLELQGVAAGVFEKHCPLLPRLPCPQRNLEGHRIFSACSACAESRHFKMSYKDTACASMTENSASLDIPAVNGNLIDRASPLKRR